VKYQKVSQSLEVARAKTEQMELTKQNRFFLLFPLLIGVQEK